MKLKNQKQLKTLIHSSEQLRQEAILNEIRTINEQIELKIKHNEMEKSL